MGFSLKKVTKSLSSPQAIAGALVGGALAIPTGGLSIPAGMAIGGGSGALSNLFGSSKSENAPGFSPAQDPYAGLYTQQLMQYFQSLQEYQDLSYQEAGYMRETDPTTGQQKWVKSPELIAAEQQQQESLAKQQELTDIVLERQLKAERGELDLSPTAERRRQENFIAWKDQQLRQGRQILGDTPETAVAKGTAAEEALQNFNESLASEREAERFGELSRIGSAFTASSMSTQAPFLGMTPLTQPAAPNMGGLQALQLASQPFQFGQQMAFNSASLSNQNYWQQQNIKSQNLSGLLQLGGMLGSAYLTRGASATPKPTLTPDPLV